MKQVLKDMRFPKRFKKAGSALVAGGALLSASSAVYAQDAQTEVTTAISTMEAMALAVMGSILAVVVAVQAYHLAVKLVKSVRSKI